jgi:hypothetical protein
MWSASGSGRASGRAARPSLVVQPWRDRRPSCVRTAGYDASDHAERNREHARLRFLVLPHASPVSQTGVGKQKTAPQDRHKILIFLIEFGAGEGIRALDPNLGQVGGGH